MKQLALWDVHPAELKQYKAVSSNDWKWSLSDYPKEGNGIKVFSCFACGGGSTMGYKLAGCDVIGSLEIDKRVNDIYVLNHAPKHNYCMDIRQFNQLAELPDELLHLDILDGSPPCTTFSMSGKRERSWGKYKKFREGQAEQTLDDLLFVFVDTVAKLQPKVAIMENVEGLMRGNAFTYVQDVYRHFRAIGYTIRHWLLKGETMGVPQRRHRLFFIATRMPFDLDKVDLSFNYAPVTFGQIKSKEGVGLAKRDGVLQLLIDNMQYGDKGLDDVGLRLRGKGSCFNQTIVYDNEVYYTVPAKSCNIRWDTKNYLSSQDVINAATFPQDYNFGENASHALVQYICGMSVPPLMIKRIMERLLKHKAALFGNTAAPVR
jgi:DNA (cytosine-5)-methyltransferase 1